MPDDAAVRAHLEHYYDTVPRAVARAEDIGSLTLFVREGPGSAYYGRPTLGHPGPVSGADLARLLARQRELDLPRSLEWVAETTPSLAAVATAAGLQVHEHPLMVRTDTVVPSADRGSAAPTARILTADDPLLPAVDAVQHLGFAAPGTARGEVGRTELAAATTTEKAVAAGALLAEKIRSGRSPHAAVVESGVVLAAGAHVPVGATTEIVAVATLPSERRRGLATAVTSALVSDALKHGVRTIFLSAGDADVARIYRRLGFVDVGTALIADEG